MKNPIRVLLCLCTAVLLTGCAARRASPPAAETQTPDAVEALPAAETGPAAELDLTGLSDSAAFRAVRDLLLFPERYTGRTVKVSGVCAVYYDEAADVYRYACRLPGADGDALLEFLPADGERPPAPDRAITVFGVFDLSAEGPFLRCALRDARLPAQGA